MNVAHMLNGESFHIERLMYVPLNKQQPLYLRPHTVVTTGTAANVIANRLEESGAGMLSTSLINDISREIIRPSTVAYDTIINQGWMSEDRFVFILKVRHCGLGGDTITYFQGFTNCADINIQGDHATAAHDLVHHISSAIETTEVVLNTPMGPNRIEKLSRIYDVITDETKSGIYLQRPSDIINNIKSLEIAKRVNIGGGYFGDDDFTRSVINGSNKIHQFTPRAETSKVDNNVASMYLTSVINDGLKDRKVKDYTHDSSFDFDPTHEDHSTVETILGKNRFLSYLSAITGYRTVRGNFTFNDLLNVDAYGANNFEVGNVMPETFQDAFSQTPHDGGGEYWNQQDVTTPVAYSIIQSSISLVAKYGFSMAVIHVDNRYTPMVDTCNVIISNSFSYLNVGPRDNQILLEMLRTKFFHEVFLVETGGGAMPIKADIYIDLIGDSKVYIEFGYEQGTWYTLPTVANSYAVPTISKSLEQYNGVTELFGSFIDTVKGVIDRDQEQHSVSHNNTPQWQQPEIFQPTML